ncbi:hypothetical protein ABQE96_21525 [Mycobacteroides chelonae]
MPAFSVMIAVLVDGTGVPNTLVEHADDANAAASLLVSRYIAPQRHRCTSDVYG